MKTSALSGTGRTMKTKPAAEECCSKVGELKRGPWTTEEDELLASYVKREGEGRWRTLPEKAGLLRCGKSCRLRWMNYLRPSVKRGQISPEEEDLILRLHRLIGNRWSLIAGRIPGRTDNEIKNYWNTHLRKKLISQGIDPKTHKPLSNPNSSSIDNNNTLFNPSSSDHQVLVLHGSSVSGQNYALPVENVTTINSIAQVGDGDMDNYPHSVKTYNEYGWKKLQVAENSEDGRISNGNGDDVMINYSSHNDAFSSFFDSLINDDMFGNQQHQDQQEHEQHDQCSSSLL